MVKFEGENGIDLELILSNLREQFGCSVQKIRKLFVQACCRNVVYNEIADMIAYMLEEEGV